MHRVHELLSLNRPSDGLLARLDVRVKLAVALAAILAVVMSTRAWLPLAVAALCIVVWITGRAPLRAVLVRLAAPLSLAAVACLLRALLTGTTPLASFSVGPWRLVATREGLADGAMIGARVLASVSVVILLGWATPAHKMFGALRWAGLPRTWVEITLLMYRHLFTLFEQAASVLSAQKVRLGYGGFRRSINSAAALAGIVVLRSLDQAEKSHEAMLARGYRGSLQIPPLPPMSRRDCLVTAVCLFVIIAAYLAAESLLL